MKIAVLSDIHGNIFALNAIFKEIAKIGIDKILFLGDFVGYYYHPKEVFDLLREHGATMIMGNHETLLIDCLDGKLHIDDLSHKYGRGHEFALNQLSTEDLEYIRQMTISHSENLNGISIGCFHGSPFDTNYYLYPNSKTDILKKCETEYNYTFVGHSHIPFVHMQANGLLINVGSVGQNRKIGGIANWCLINLENSVFEIKSTFYNVQPLIKLINKYDPKIAYLGNVLRRK